MQQGRNALLLPQRRVADCCLMLGIINQCFNFKKTGNSCFALPIDKVLAFMLYIYSAS